MMERCWAQLLFDKYCRKVMLIKIRWTSVVKMKMMWSYRSPTFLFLLEYNRSASSLFLIQTHAVSKYRLTKMKRNKKRVKMRFLSRWHVYASPSNRSAILCSITIEKIVSYTQLPLLFNKNRSYCIGVRAVKSLFSFFFFFSFVLIESIFFWPDRVKEKERVENICVSVRVDD